ncbi:uncharacterized protein LOC126749043 isoform X2 [Anthonomus grandis grandis]|uniref:uncharacterized protein LOC126749043 isoform X2 n=1 Tax=Anthonomus grandis grandis TaxID=2921223 RepID=UPI0021659FBB|nr:uncharacterized protein LOC126749043 isoform X2 [Anthonomus grandis grandis]
MYDSFSLSQYCQGGEKIQEVEMPSAEVCPIPKMSAPVPSKEQTFNIAVSSNDVEGLVLEIKENLRLSSGPPSLKAIPCSHLSRKSSRASPYRLPGKYFCDSCEPTCVRHKNKQADLNQQDPYELLQALLRSENLINEAVRRVQMGFSTKKFYYESDEESSRSSILALDD